VQHEAPLSQMLLKGVSSAMSVAWYECMMEEDCNSVGKKEVGHSG